MNTKKLTAYMTILFLLQPTLHAQGTVADAFCNLGNACYKEGNMQQAEHHYYLTLERCSEHTQAIAQLGTLHFQQKQYESAQPYLEKRTQQHPEDEEAGIMLAHCYLWQKQYAHAAQLYTHILSRNTRRVDLFLYRAQCNKRQRKFTQALHDIDQFLAAFPQDHSAQLLKAYVLEHIGQYDQALTILEQLPQSPNILTAKAHIYKTIGKPDEAIDLYTKAHTAQPDNRTYLLGLSYSYLLAGDSINGYAIMKKYLSTQSNRQRFLDNTNKINGKRIFIGAEILLDNMIQHVRFAHCIKQRGGTTIVQASEPLIDLLANCPLIDELVSTTQKIPTYDYHIPVILLPWLFETHAIDSVPYLKANPALAAQWHARLPHNNHQNIGVCWHLNESLHSPTEQRPIATEQLEALFALSDYNFFALYAKNQQPDLKSLKSNSQLITMCGAGFSEAPDEMASLLALLDSLDIIVTIDTTIAHLAGALGKKTYLLLPYHTNWRWGLEHSDSPWYPTIEILRQTEPGSWIEPISQLIATLKKSS